MEMLVLALVNMGLLWSLLAYVGVVSLVMEKGTHGPDNGAAFYVLTACLLPVLLTWWLATSLVVYRGHFDYLGWARNWQYLWAIGSSLGLILLVMASALERKFAVAGFAILPAMTILLPMLVYRVGPLPVARNGFLGVSAAGMLVIAACFAYMLFRTGQHRWMRFLHRGKPDSFVLGMVQNTDPAQNFCSLLSFTSRSTHRQVRALALEKMHSMQDWDQRVETCLRNRYYDSALVFLADNDVPDPSLYTESIRKAIRLMIDDARAETLYPARYEQRKAIRVTQKWTKQYGADYTQELADLDYAIGQMKRRD